jgi:hypothetical protein
VSAALAIVAPMPPPNSDDPTALVAAALLLERAAQVANTPRERQLVAIAEAHLRGERDLVDALARDHLVDYPDSVLVAWIAKEQP